MERTGVGAVIIGNEVLTAKVADRNGALLIRRLRDRGIALRSLAVIPDEVDAIVEAVQAARARARFVITSGGIGATHDDVTVRAVALALGRRVIRHPEIVELIRRRTQGEPSEATLRLAEAPEGTGLLALQEGYHPVIACEGVFVLPGVPQLFALQLERVLQELPGRPVVLRNLYLDCGEPEIAPLLDEVSARWPEVALGSYPQWGREVAFRTKLTVEHPEVGPVAEVVARLCEGLPPGALLRIE